MLCFQLGGVIMSEKKGKKENTSKYVNPVVSWSLFFGALAIAVVIAVIAWC